MALKDRIQEDIKAAMRAKDSARLTALRLLMAAVKQREIDERRELDNAQVLTVIDKLTKQRRDSIAQFEAAARKDLADKEKSELSLLESYLPAPLSDAEAQAVIDEAIAAVQASGPQDMGKVMARLKPLLAGRADMGKISGLVRARLGS